MGLHRHLLIPVDASQASIKSFEWALENLYKPGDEVHVLHIIAPGRHYVMTTDVGLDGVVEDDETTKQKQYEAAEKLLQERFMARMEQQNIPCRMEILRCPLDNDSIGQLICERAEQLRATAVVMARHTKGAFKELLVGSATNYCTHHCKSPVLVMHAD